MTTNVEDNSSKISLKPFSHFALRIPAYPINKYLEKEHSDFLDIFENDIYFQEAIFWASPSLYNSIVYKSNKSLKDKESINTSLKNYYKRMSSRSTPFGTFSGFTIGKFSNNTDFDTNYKLIKNYRVSYVWLSGIINEIEAEYDLLKFLKVKFNGNIYRKNNRLYLYDNIDANSMSSIEYTEQINYILKFGKQSINVEELILKISEIYGIEFKDKIINLIVGLVKNRYLISELRVENVKLDTIICLLEKAHIYDNYVQDLKVINELIEKLNTDQKFNESICNTLIQNMKILNETNDYIQVDTKIENINISLHNDIANSVCEAYQWIWNKFGFYKKYIEEKELFLSKFIDTYGENVKVPIKHLYMNGLGVEDLIYKFKKEDTLKLNEINTLIVNKINDCMLNKSKEISLDDIDINFSNLNKEDFPMDLEVYGRIIFPDMTNKSKYKFIVNNSSYGDSVGSSCGRFSDLINDNNFFEDLNKFYNSNDIEFLQIFHESYDDKLQNVMRNSDILKKNVKLNLYDNLNSIDINDISVVAQNNKLYLWSDKLNKQIKLTKLHMLNPIHLPNIYQVLLNIDKFNECIPNLCIFRNLTSYNYSPRIKYKNIILKPVTWTICDYFITEFNENNWTEYFKQFKENYNLDKYINVVKADNKLLINTEHLDDIKTLFNLLKKDKMLLMEEIYGLSDQQLIEINNNSYLSEIVIPLTSTNKINKLKGVPKDISTHKHYLLGNDYIYIKLYINVNKIDLVLTDYLYPFIDELIEGSYIDEMFFIRYYEQRSHLRIRLKGNNKKLLTIIPSITDFFEKLNEVSLSNDMSFDIYNPEMNRYGGEKYFAFVEKHFCHESIFVMKVLSKIRDKTISVPIEAILVASLISMFKSMNLSYNECCEFIDINDKSKKNVINYRDYRNIIINIIQDKNSDDEIREIKDLIYEKDNHSQLKKLKDIKDKKYMYSIVNSLIHMSCNRFNFSDVLFEVKVRELLRCIVRDSKNWGYLQ